MRSSSGRVPSSRRRTFARAVAATLGLAVVAILLGEADVRSHGSRSPAVQTRAATRIELLAPVASMGEAAVTSERSVASAFTEAGGVASPGAPLAPGPVLLSSPAVSGPSFEIARAGSIVTTGDIVQVRGWVTLVAGDDMFPAPGVAVSLTATAPNPLARESDHEEVSRRVAAVSPERRHAIADATRSGESVVVLGTTETGADGSFSFTLDRTGLWESTSLRAFAEARREGGVRLVASTDEHSLPNRNDFSSIFPNMVTFAPIRLREATRLSVRVTTEGAPVAGAAVGVDDTFRLDATTDGRGRCDLEIVEEKPRFVVSMPGFATEEGEVSPGSGSLDVALVRDCPVSVRVVDAAGAAVPASIELMSWSSTELSTDGNGAATLRGLAAGRSYDVSVKPNVDFVPISVTITPPCETVVVRVDPAATLEVQLTFDATVPASVAAEPLRAWLLRLGENGVWGRVHHMRFESGVGTFTRMAPGTYRVVTDPDVPQLAPALSPPITVAAAPVPSRIAVEQSVGRNVGGWCVDENGARVAASGTVAETLGELKMQNTGWLEGRFPKNEVHLTVTAAGYQDATVVVPADATSFGPVVLRSVAGR